MRKITLSMFLLFICLPWMGMSQVMDKKMIESSKEPQYDRAPLSTYIGKQVNATKADIYSQGFNEATVPTGWSIIDVIGTLGDVTFVTTSTYPSGFVPSEGTHMARFNSYNASAGNNVRLGQTTSFSTAGYISVKVNFDWLCDPAYSGNRDSVYVQWSTNGITWNTAGGVGRYSTTAGWTAQSFNLPAGANNQPNLYVAFYFVSKYGNNCHLDNLVVTGDLLLANDLSVTGWVAPIDGSDISATDTVKIAVTNPGTANASNFNISYSVNGGVSFVTQNIPGPINAGSTNTYTFTNTANMGVYKTYNCVATVNLTGDQNTANDTLRTTVTKIPPTYNDTCYTQMLPLWSGTVAAGSIADSSYIKVVSGATGVSDTTGWIKFDISSIPDNAVVSGVELHAYVNADNYAYFNVMSLEHDPMASLPDTIFNDTKNGNTYYTYNANFPSPAWFVGSLSAVANNDFMNRLPNNWFGVGLWEYESSAGYYLEYDGWQETNKPFIKVTYKLPLSLDVALLGFTNPVTGYNPSNQVSIKIKNMGTDPVTQIPVSYVMNGDTVTENTPAGVTINYNEEYIYTFTQTIDVSAPGVYSLVGFQEYPGDINLVNDRVTYSFTKYAPFYPLALNFNTSALAASYGPVYKNGNYYVSRWNMNSIYVLNNMGTLVTALPVTSISGFKDLSADTNYIYGGVSTSMLYQDSIANDTAYTIHNYSTAISVRGSDYDPVNDAIWICNWNAGEENLLLVNKTTGATLQTVINPNPGLYGFGGLSYDYWTPGGPYLVGLSQHNHGNQLVWVKISNGTVLVDHDVVQDIPEALNAGAISGGAFVSKEAVPGSAILGGVIQNFRLFGFKIASTDITSYSLPGQINSEIDPVAKEINVSFPFNANLTGIAPNFNLNDFHELAKAYNNGVLQISGVNPFNLTDGDTLIYHVVRMNFNSTDSVYIDWKVIISIMDPPAITTTNATNIDYTSAILNGSILPNYVVVTGVHFEYGSTTSYGSTVSPGNTTASGDTLVPFDASILGLLPNTTYHFRLTGMVNTQTLNGNDMTFTTLEYPVMTTGVASNIAFTSADVAGTVDPNDTTVVNIGFLLGTAAGVYPDTIPGTPNTANGNAPVSIFASLTGLNAGTTYYYKILGMIGSNSYTGNELSFSTFEYPVMTTGVASNITITSADIAGTVDPNNTTVVNIGFLIGTSAGVYPDTILGTPNTANGNAPVSISASLAGLNAGTTYYYKILGTVGSNSYTGSELSFTTLDYILEVSPIVQNVNSSAGSVDYIVTCNTNWTAVSNQPWCAVTGSGAGNGTITANYLVNPAGTLRTANIIVSAGSLLDTVFLNQGASGINEITEFNINIYPNPSTGIFYIEVKGALEMQVFDILGQVIISDVIFDRKTIDLTNQSKGTYILRLKSQYHIMNFQLLLK
jgi:hypothetical protein